ncbi:MAG: MotA/TolQ/ExbB proton channel family protein [Myxococcales bacterium]|nr:MotA/TolQ/ExbB proton channel family protein [Myxococcales bacterium]MDP3502681.1 MotA/TolQ/ExbB proton channel family protein [Myxococcales bacterium]
MTSLLIVGQMNPEHGGWLTRKLLATFTGDAEWVLWLLGVLSVLSIAVMLERAIYFATHRLGNSDDILLKLAKGDLDSVKTAVGQQKGMEASVLREGLEWLSKGPDSVEEVINATLARERPRYERFLSFLGTLGANTPFIGLFGTVLGIIKAFADLGATGAKGAEVQSTVMAGISEALVATAVGLAVAIPAVIGYNILQRSVKTTVARSNALGHALVGHLRSSAGK